jgi:hypothetical protein
VERVIDDVLLPVVAPRDRARPEPASL